MVTDFAIEAARGVIVTVDSFGGSPLLLPHASSMESADHPSTRDWVMKIGITRAFDPGLVLSRLNHSSRSA
jgi:hypothetical protein